MEKKKQIQNSKKEEKNAEVELKRVRKSLRTNVVGGWRMQLE